VIPELLPHTVPAVETDANSLTADAWPEEMHSLGRVVERRLHEFALARACARRALVQLGLAPQAIPVDGDRCPTWPPGIVGSITHCRDYCAAAVAFRARVAGVGIDAEVNEPVPPSILRVIVSADENHEIRALPQIGVAWDRLVFSAKESAYKVWYPIMRAWLDFDAARIQIRPDPVDATRGAFEVQLLATPLSVDGRVLGRLEGRFAIASGLIVTAITVDAVSSAGSAA
jgi:4'-phosphopantetheinyl transferase EntD